MKSVRLRPEGSNTLVTLVLVAFFFFFNVEWETKLSIFDNPFTSKFAALLVRPALLRESHPALRSLAAFVRTFGPNLMSNRESSQKRSLPPARRVPSHARRHFITGRAITAHPSKSRKCPLPSSNY